MKKVFSLQVFTKNAAFIILPLFLLFCSHAHAQTRAVYFIGYNSATASFPIAAQGMQTGVVNSGALNYSGLSTVNDNRTVWSNTNASPTLDVSTAPYLSYTVNFNAGKITFDRFVMCGLAKFAATKMQLRWSVDNYASSLGEFTSNGSSYTLTSVNLSSLGSINVNGDVVFRVYFYNAANWIFNSDTGPYPSLDATPASYGAYGQNVALWYSSYASVLPVKWLSFDVLKQQENVLLKWSTATEVNARSFTIQHSPDGTTWNDIGEVAAQVNSGGIHNYSFPDGSPVKGMNYYRIIQKDADNNISFSKIITANFEELAGGFDILGNRITNGTLELKLKEAAVVRIFGIDGRLLFKKQVSGGIHSIDVSHYSKGMYSIQADSEVKKFFILH